MILPNDSRECVSYHAIRKCVHHLASYICLTLSQETPFMSKILPKLHQLFHNVVDYSILLSIIPINPFIIPYLLLQISIPADQCFKYIHSNHYLC